jgi:hypothetical protein
VGLLFSSTGLHEGKAATDVPRLGEDLPDRQWLVTIDVHGDVRGKP